MGQEGVPLGPGLSVCHQEVRAVFLAEVFAIVKADALPVLVGNDVSQWDIVAPHEFGGESRGAIEGGCTGVSSVLTHFDAK